MFLSPSDLGLFLVAAISLNVTPGPDTLYVIGRSIGQGRMAGIVSVLGGSTGRVLHTLFAAFGVTALLLVYPSALRIIKSAGALFLIFLAIRMILRNAADQQSAKASESLFAIYRQGLFTNLLNPAVAIFFLSFLPQFTSPDKGSVAIQIIILGLIFTTTATLWSMILAVFSGSAGAWIAKHSSFAKRQHYVTAAILFALGVYFLF